MTIGIHSMSVKNSWTRPFALFRASQDGLVTNGAHSLTVKSGEEYNVVRDLYDCALAAGMTPLTNLAPELVEEEEARVLPSEDEKIAALVEPCEILVARGVSKDFTTVGDPKVSSIRKLVDFDFSKQQLLQAHKLAIFNATNNSD